MWFTVSRVTLAVENKHWDIHLDIYVFAWMISNQQYKEDLNPKNNQNRNYHNRNPLLRWSTIGNTINEASVFQVLIRTPPVTFNKWLFNTKIPIILCIFHILMFKSFLIIMTYLEGHSMNNATIELANKNMFLVPNFVIIIKQYHILRG